MKRTQFLCIYLLLKSLSVYLENTHSFRMTVFTRNKRNVMFVDGFDFEYVEFLNGTFYVNKNNSVSIKLR